MLQGIAAYMRRHHIALLALFFALGGTAFAAGNALLPKNSVGTAQLKNGAVVKAKIAKKTLAQLKGNRGAQGAPGAAGPQGPQGPQGLQGPAGPGARWAAVNPNGTIAIQSGGITVSHTASTGVYILNFGEDTSKKLILVSPSTLNDASFRGTALASSCATPSGTPTGLVSCPTTNPQNYVFVGELAIGDGAVADHAFYVSVVGPAGTGATAATATATAKAGPFAAG